MLKPVDGLGLAIFRIAFFFVLLLEVNDLFHLRHLFYDRVPYLESGEIALLFPFCIWQLSLLFLISGFLTRIAAVVNYVCVLIFLTGLTTFEYHMDYVYTGISFLAIFLPMASVFSVDRYIIKWKAIKRDTNIPTLRHVSAYNYYVPVLFGLAVVYSDSMLFKFTSPMWMGGLGMWTPASMAPVTIFNDSWLLDLEALMKGLGILTLIFEFVFIFLFWFKKFRLPLLILGVGLHFGIYIEFPIPYFAFGSIAIYTLMVPIGFFKKIESSLNANSTIKTIIAKIDIGKVWDAKPVISRSTSPANELFNRSKWIAIGVGLLLLCQLNISLFSPFAYKFTDKIVYSLPKSISSTIVKTHRNIAFVSQKFFGITFHPVFMDFHFRNMTSLSLIHTNGDKEIVLPLIDEDGMPNENIKGGAWVNWVFRIGPATAVRNFEKSSAGIKRFTAYWIGANGLDFQENHKFILKERRMDYPGHWEKGLLERNLNKEWSEIGVAEWNNQEFSMRFNQTEIEDVNN